MLQLVKLVVFAASCILSCVTGLMERKEFCGGRKSLLMLTPKANSNRNVLKSFTMQLASVVGATSRFGSHQLEYEIYKTNHQNENLAGGRSLPELYLPLRSRINSGGGGVEVGMHKTALK